MNIVEVKNLNFSYEENVLVINNVSFNIEKGKYTTIIGHNGSGKSTIAKLLIGLLNRNDGDIIVDGDLLNEENLMKIRNKVGIVFQNPDNQFIGSTVRDDIAFGLENHLVEQKDMDKIIEEFSSIVKMSDYLNSEPTRLSGGQKQRVAIAGVLAMKPDIIIFDEATSMLDPQGKEEIKNVIMNLHDNENLTIVSITHDIEEVAKSDKVIVLNKGEILFEGNPVDVMSKGKELSDIGLDMPYSMKIVEELKKRNIDIENYVTMESLVEDLGNRI